MTTLYVVKRTSKTDPDYTWRNIETALQISGNITRFEDREYIWEKTSDRKTSEILKGLEVEYRLFRKSDEEKYGVVMPPRHRNGIEADGYRYTGLIS